MSLSFRTLKPEDLAKIEKNYAVGRFEFVIVDGTCKGIQFEFEEAFGKTIRVAMRYEDYSMRVVQLEPPKCYGFTVRLDGLPPMTQTFDTATERDEAVKGLSEDVQKYVSTFEGEAPL